ncbi:hypothetical protein [Nocardia sp. NBC_01388]|uniref:hypothetical protein n=1 Tax=Nocardia sp. NBC_01388 TaxID=2903596 RepID=UPI00324A09C6
MTAFLDRFRRVEFWEIERWQLRPLIGRVRAWACATRTRRWITGIALMFLVLFVLPGLVGTAAMAGAAGSGSSGDSALSWMDVKDSSGVELSNYVFATNDGSVLHPMTTGIALVISLEFAGWMVIVTIGIWLITYVLSFRWLDLFSAPLRAVARTLSAQVAVPIVLITAATIGAFFVAWFVLRGLHAKAAMQIATMLGVAVLAPIFLADPLSDVLSSDGWLIQGRDLGIEIAAGLNGQSNPQPGQLVSSMQGQLADNFARSPLQVWNFGHVVDVSSACRSAWSAAAGDEGQTASAMQACGDTAAHNAAEKPGVGQIGAGILLLIAGTLLLAFAAVLAIKIVWSALDSVYHGLMAIFGFAAGGFIYGPTQTFLVRSVVHGFFAAARMAAEVVYLGVYVLFLGDLFKQAQGQVMSVFIIGAIVEVVAILQLRRLTAGLEKGNDWVANRFAMAIQNGGRAGAGGGSGGGTALGMGTLGAGRSMSALGMLGAVSAIGSSPLTEWAWGMTRTPFRPQARKERKSSLAQWDIWGAPGFGGPDGTYMQSYAHFPAFAAAARKGALAYGGINTAMGAAAAIQHAVDSGAGRIHLPAALRGAGFTRDDIIEHAISSWGIIDDNAQNSVLADKQLGRVVAGMQRVQPGGKARSGEEEAADLATLQSAAYVYRRASKGGRPLDGGMPTGQQRDYVDNYMDRPTKEKMEALKNLADGSTKPGTAGVSMTRGVPPLSGITQEEAQDMLRWIGNEHSFRVLEAANALTADRQNPLLMRQLQAAVADAQATDSYASGIAPSPWKIAANPYPALSRPRPVP